MCVQGFKTESLICALGVPPFMPAFALADPLLATHPLQRTAWRRLARIDLPIPANGALTVSDLPIQRTPTRAHEHTRVQPVCTRASDLQIW